MASSARRVVVEFIGDDKSASSAARKVDGATRSLGDTFSRVGKIAAVGLAVGIGAAAYAMTGAVKAAVEDQASASKLATALHNVTGATKAQVAAVEDYILQTSLATGIADDELRPAFQRLAEATGSVQVAQSRMQMAMNISAGTGKSLESVTMALAKAQNGSVTGLSRLGVATKNAKGETLSFDKILVQLGNKFAGQSAQHAETFQGKMDRLKVVFNEAKETIGYALIPILTTLADKFIKDVVPAIQQAAEWSSVHLVPALKDFASFVSGTVLPILVSIGKFLVDNFEVVGPIVAVIGSMVAAMVVLNAVVKAYTAVQMALNVVLTANPIGLVIVAIAGLVAAFVIAYKKSETFRAIVDGAMHGVSAAVGFLVNFVKANWPIMIAVMTGGLAIVVLTVVKNWDKIKSVFQTAIGAVKGFVITGFHAMIDFFLNIALKFLQGADKMFGWVPGIGDKLGDAVDAFKTFKERMDASLDAAAASARAKGTAVGKAASQGVASGLAVGLVNIQTAATQIVREIDKVLRKQAEISSPSRLTMRIGVLLGQGLTQGLIDGVEGDKDKLTKVLDSITAAVQKAGDKLRSLMGERSSFQSGFVSSFSQGVFGSEATDVNSILALAKSQAADAAKLKRDTRKLSKMGLSDALLKQLSSSGPEGIAQIHALASGASRSQISQLNRSTAGQAANLHGAARAAGTEIYGSDIKDARRDLALAKHIGKEFKDAIHDMGDKIVIQVMLDGKEITTSQRHHKRRTGQALGLA